jgi:glutamate/aspartate transport system substrate-binding protein
MSCKPLARLFGVLWIAGVAAAALPAAAQTLERLRATGAITLGYRDASVPFSYLDADKRPIGISIDLCLRVVEGLRRELRLPNLRVDWVPVTSATRIDLVEQGKVDLECGSTTNNAARRQRVAFTITHYFAGGRFLVRSNSGIRGLADLERRAIVTTSGTTHLRALREAQDKGLFGGRILEGADHDASFALLARGEADAFLMDDIQLFAFRATAPKPQEWAVVGELRSVEPLAIMLRKDEAFKQRVDAILTRVFVDGEFAVLYQKWFLAPIPPRGVVLGVPMSPLLIEQTRWPSDKVGDALGG